MQTADSRLCLHMADHIRSRFGRPITRRPFTQPGMGSIVVVIANVIEAEAHQMPLVEWDYVIQHFASYAAHPSFRDSVLPRTANARPDRLDSARLQKCTHRGAEFGVVVEDGVTKCARKR